VEKATFERLIDSAGFEAVNVYGDYAYSPFNEAVSPFMIWVLQKDSSKAVR
jgi:hypothetical protein